MNGIIPVPPTVSTQSITYSEPNTHKPSEVEISFVDTTLGIEITPLTIPSTEGPAGPCQNYRLYVYKVTEGGNELNPNIESTDPTPGPTYFTVPNTGIYNIISANVVNGFIPDSVYLVEVSSVGYTGLLSELTTSNQASPV